MEKIHEESEWKNFIYWLCGRSHHSHGAQSLRISAGGGNKRDIEAVKAPFRLLGNSRKVITNIPSKKHGSINPQ